MEFHPFANEYPLANDATLVLIATDMRSRGYDERFPIVLFDGQILDGRIRSKAAKDSGVNPSYTVFEGSEDDARAFVARANENRRHLTDEWLQKRRSERIERVVDARTQGQSLRTIAETEGVSPKTVHDDLKKAAVTGGNSEPESGKIIGQDGREHPATKPPKPEPIRCPRCSRDARIGNKLPKSCADCKKLREDAKPPTKGKGTSAGTDRGDSYEPTPGDIEEDKNAKRAADATRDQMGAEVPKNLRDVFNEPLVADAITFVKKLRKAIHGSQRIYPYLHDKVLFDLCDSLVAKLDYGRPWVVCDECKGKGCKHCRMSGYVSRGMFEEQAKTGGKK